MTRDLTYSLEESAWGSGKKQHNHIIARSDNFGGARQSITAITSTWSDGTGGPLGLCFPEGAYKQKQVGSVQKCVWLIRAGMIHYRNDDPMRLFATFPGV